MTLCWLGERRSAGWLAAGLIVQAMLPHSLTVGLAALLIVELAVILAGPCAAHQLQQRRGEFSRDRARFGGGRGRRTIRRARTLSAGQRRAAARARAADPRQDFLVQTLVLPVVIVFSQIIFQGRLHSPRSPASAMPRSHRSPSNRGLYLDDVGVSDAQFRRRERCGCSSPFPVHRKYSC